MQDIVLSLKNITKRYPGVVALNNVSIDFIKGEVHALLGENGAGKSTLIKVLSGAVKNDEGNIIIDDKVYDNMNPKRSRGHGIEVIYQEYNLINSLSVAENICLGEKVEGLVNHKSMREKVKKIFENFNIDIDPDVKVRELSPALQQLVEIAKAISKDAKIIVMDEPTAQLTLGEVENLYKIIEALKKRGVTIIYISHRLEEIFKVTDRVSIMRDGEYVTTVNTKDTNRKELISLMVGRALTESYPKRNCIKDEKILEIKNLSGIKSSNISFEVKKGEILGLAGLVGAGRTELVRVIFGADKKLGGEIFIKGNKVQIKSPKQALKYGIGLIPEDRKNQGCFLRSSIKWNISISSIRDISKNSFVNNNIELQQANEYKNKLNIKTPTVEQKVGNLSGGNQQKVVLAKVLSTNSDIIIFDEPTRGIDVGARHEIYNIMNELVESGKSIIMISSDMEELLGMSDRIIVLCEGKIAGEVLKDDFSQNKILELASSN